MLHRGVAGGLLTQAELSLQYTSAHLSLLVLRRAPISRLPGPTFVCCPAALASEGISSGRGSGWALLTAEALPPPAITKSNAAFAAKGLEFVVGHDNVSLSELNDLFERARPG